MDTGTLILIVVVILALVAVIGLLRYSRRGRAGVTTPWGSVNVEGENPELDPSASQRLKGARISDSVSTHGGAHAHDTTGAGATIDRTQVKKDLTATSSDAAPDPDPKAPAP